MTPIADPVFSDRYFSTSSSPILSPSVRNFSTTASHRAILGSIGTTVWENHLRILAEKSKVSLSGVGPHISYFRALIGDDPMTTALDAETREAYAVELVERYEELTQLWEGYATENPYPALTDLIRNQDAYNYYLRALLLVKSNMPNSEVVALAAKRRDDILAHYNVTPTTTPETETTDTQTELNPEELKKQVLLAALQRTRPGAKNRSTWASFGHQLGSEKEAAGQTASTASAASSFWSSLNPVKPPGSGKNDFKIVVEDNKGTITFRILRFVGIVTVFTVAGITVLSWIAEHVKFSLASGPAAGGRGFQSHSPSKHQPNEKPTNTFADVHGCEEAKEELVEIVEFLKNPVKFTKLGGRLPKGVLLVGEPGTGKTLLARAVAGEAGVNFFYASGAEFDEVFVGVGAARIRELFKQARANSPAIVFIDELDAIGARRSAKDQQYAKQTLNQLLVELDGFSQTDGLIIIGATNLPQMLDSALTRPGRFDKEVNVPLPDVRGRLHILKHHLTKIKYDRSIDLAIVARGTPGFSGAQLENLVNQAAIKASVDNSEAVSLRDMIWARDKIYMGAERKSAVITAENKLATAYHEGGHALVALLNKHCDPLLQVTVMPRGRALGITWSLPTMDKTNTTYLQYLAKIEMAMGGRAAEKLLYGKENITDGASSDISNATKLASAMVRRLGFSDSVGPVDLSAEKVSAATNALVEKEVRKIIEDAQESAFKRLSDHRLELDRLAEALVEYETLNLEEVNKVIKGIPLTQRQLELEEAKKLEVKVENGKHDGESGIGIEVGATGKEAEPENLKRDH